MEAASCWTTELEFERRLAGILCWEVVDGGDCIEDDEVPVRCRRTDCSNAVFEGADSSFRTTVGGLVVRGRSDLLDTELVPELKS